MLHNTLTMLQAILIEICTNAPYRPGHWLLSDVTPEPQTLSPLPIGPCVAAGTTQSGHS